MKLTHKQEMLLGWMSNQAQPQEYFEIRKVFGTKLNGKRMPLGKDLAVLVAAGLLVKTKAHQGQATYYTPSQYEAYKIITDENFVLFQQLFNKEAA